MDELYDDFFEKTDYLTETKGLLKDRINSLGGSITSGTTFRDYLVWLDSLYEALDEKTITGLPDSLEGKCEQTTTQTGKNLFDGIFRQGNRYTTGLSDTTRLFTTQNYPVENGKTYTISTTLDTSAYKWAVNLSATPFPFTSGTSYFYDSGWKYLSSFTFTPSQDGYLGIVVSKSNGTDSLTPNDISNIKWQLEVGSSATSYEPYIPNSPSPDYPQPINITTGRQVVSVRGKNLFETMSSSTSQGVTLTPNSDGSYTLNGTTTGVAIFNKTLTTQLPPGTYTVSYESSVPLASDFFVRIRKANGTMLVPNGIPSQVVGNNTTTNKTTFTSTDYGAIVAINLVTTGITYNNVNVKIQLEKGNTPSTYEEYKGNDYEINLGKNLLSNSTFRQGNAGGSVSGNRIFCDANYLLKANYTYTLSTDLDTSVYRYNILTSLTPFPSTNTVYNSGWVTTSSKTFTPTQDTYIGINLGKTNDGNLTPTDIEGVQWQLEKGSQATSYSPYKTPIYLGKIGTYQDYIFRNTTENPLYDSNLEEGQWYIHKEIGRVVFNGSENWQIRNDVVQTGYTCFRNGSYVINSRYNASLITNLYCNYFMPTSGSYGATPMLRIINANEYGETFMFPSSIASTVADFKTWVSNHNIIIYYYLITPTNTLIEDEELINQLNEIEIFTVISEDFYN